ncbi:hypothetical protein [Tenuifilum thalassicum]|uniref:Lipoprotein n=1 Tax=Tenuifilum thalassicum TaxID=2590900 RepID=A0A7D3XJI7_9BACT|nr:hypothetical protein [Tenuifilum thalassicum]QKG78930.1 hypothetical protein FHG85_01150 [Tenuifilum thalassicum]
MKQIVYLSFAFLAFLFACNNVTFDKPQPIGGEELKSLSEAFPGIYVSADNDTLKISSNSINFTISKDDNISGTLGDNMQVKRFGNNFVVNSVDSVWNRAVWVPFLFEPNDSMLNISYIDYSKEQLVKLEQLVKDICKYEILKNDRGENTKIILKPKSTSEFEKLVKAGVFNKTIKLRNQKRSNQR